jgi:hypothetical protein
MLRRVLAKSKSATMMKQSASLSSQRASMSTSHTFDISGSYEVSFVSFWFGSVRFLFKFYMPCHVVAALAALIN